MFRLHHVTRILALGHVAIIVLFALCAFSLIAFGCVELWNTVQLGTSFPLTKRFDGILECVAMLTIAMACLELADTILQEEFSPERRMSHAARMRRVLSRFMLVVIIALAIESLVATFKFVHEDPSYLMGTALLTVAAAAPVGAWALFGRTSASSE